MAPQDLLAVALQTECTINNAHKFGNKLGGIPILRDDVFGSPSSSEQSTIGEEDLIEMDVLLVDSERVEHFVGGGITATRLVNVHKSTVW